MGDESAKRAAEEYLAAKMAEAGQSEQDKLNNEAAMAFATRVWKKAAETLTAKCQDWNTVTREQTFHCKETLVGDLRVSCAGRTQTLTMQFDSRKRIVTIKNTARPQHEKDVVMTVEGYATETGRDARLMRNNEPVNFDVLIVGELRVLAGLSRQTS